MNLEGYNIQVRDDRSRRKADVQSARPLMLGAETQEVLSIIAMWNMVAPGTKYRIDPNRPDLIGKASGHRINVLMHAVRNSRAQAAQFAASKCLEIVKDATSIGEAARRIAAAIEGQEDDATLPTKEEDKVDHQ